VERERDEFEEIKEREKVDSAGQEPRTFSNSLEKNNIITVN